MSDGRHKARQLRVRLLTDPVATFLSNQPEPPVDPIRRSIGTVLIVISVAAVISVPYWYAGPIVGYAWGATLCGFNMWIRRSGDNLPQLRRTSLHRKSRESGR